MSTRTVVRILVALKATWSTSIVDGRHSVPQVLVSLEATGTPALKVVEIVVALKAIFGRKSTPTVGRILVALKSYVVNSDS